MIFYSEKIFSENENQETFFSECVRNDIACRNACPCGEDCPDGCDGCGHPICEYDKKSSVLVLNTRDPDNQPFVIDFAGKYPS